MHSGAMVKKALRSQNMSQVALARAIGRDQSLISRYVKGTIEVSVDTVIDIAQVLNMNFDVLYGQLRKDKFNRSMEKLKFKYGER